MGATRMKHLQWLVPITLLIGLTLWFRPLGPQVDVTLRVDANAPVTGMRDIAIIVGNERMSWVQLARGDTIQASFHPSPEAAPQLTLNYGLMPPLSPSASTSQHHWVGPDVQPGQSYSIQLTLNASGEVVSLVNHAPSQR